MVKKFRIFLFSLLFNLLFLQNVRSESEWFYFLDLEGKSGIEKISLKLKGTPEEVNDTLFSTYYLYRSQGISVMVDKGEKKVKELLFYSGLSSEDYAPFKEDLPYGIKFSDSKETIIGKLGNPLEQKDNYFYFANEYPLKVFFLNNGQINYIRITPKEKKNLLPEKKIKDVSRYNPYYKLMIKNDGELLSGDCKNGSGKMVWKFANGTIITYEGNWRFGLASGNGIFKSGKETEYKGNWQGGKFHGEGRLVINTESLKYDYHGGFFEGNLNGAGELSLNGTKYIGNFRDGEMHGKGLITYPNKFSYDGEFFAGKKRGYGIEYLNGVKFYEGNWNNDFWEGYGTHYISVNEKHTGNFKESKKEGYGTYYNYIEKVKVVGNFVNNLADGNYYVYDLNDRKIGLFLFSKGKLVRKIGD